jgi:hypothetical protein
MSRQIKKADDIVAESENLVNAVWDGNLTPQAGKVIRQALHLSLEVAKTRLAYATQRGEKADIDFLK